MNQLVQICDRFSLEGKVLSVEKYGNGHINDTYLVTNTEKRYILQRINTSIFREPVKLMDNFVRVSKHISGKIAAEKAVNPSTRRRFLQVIDSYKDEPFLSTTAVISGVATFLWIRRVPMMCWKNLHRHSPLPKLLVRSRTTLPICPADCMKPSPIFTTLPAVLKI